jgi:hypothetical protein
MAMSSISASAARPVASWPLPPPVKAALSARMPSLPPERVSGAAATRPVSRSRAKLVRWAGRLGSPAAGVEEQPLAAVGGRLDAGVRVFVAQDAAEELVGVRVGGDALDGSTRPPVEPSRLGPMLRSTVIF